MSEEIIVVDKNDKVIGLKERKKITTKDIYRVSALWLTNSKGEILLAQRAFNEERDPGKWGPAVAGTVSKDDKTYEINIIKEAEEEIGLKNINFIKGPKIFNDREYIHYTQWYTAVIDKEAEDFIIEPKEVLEVRWFTKKEIEEKLVKEPDFFIPNMANNFKLFK